MSRPDCELRRLENVLPPSVVRRVVRVFRVTGRVTLAAEVAARPRATVRLMLRRLGEQVARVPQRAPKGPRAVRLTLKRRADGWLIVGGRGRLA